MLKRPVAQDYDAQHRAALRWPCTAERACVRGQGLEAINKGPRLGDWARALPSLGPSCPCCWAPSQRLEGHPQLRRRPVAIPSLCCDPFAAADRMHLRHSLWIVTHHFVVNPFVFSFFAVSLRSPGAQASAGAPWLSCVLQLMDQWWWGWGPCIQAVLKRARGSCKSTPQAVILFSSSFSPTAVF